MSTYGPPGPIDPLDNLRLEYVTTCVGFDDLLDVTLAYNHNHVDTAIVVTSHDDKRTHQVCHKYGAKCIQTDLFKKNGRTFNKGAAINAGFGYFQYHGWRMHLDADIILPDSFRRMLFNYTHLNQNKLYGADRVTVIGEKQLERAFWRTQHQYHCLIEAGINHPIGARYVHELHGYLPLGFFQMWHARCQKPYPYSLGTAAHDDTMFAALWPESQRELLPSVITYQLCASAPVWSENWGGRSSKRLDGKAPFQMTKGQNA